MLVMLFDSYPDLKNSPGAVFEKAARYSLCAPKWFRAARYLAHMEKR